MTLLKAAECIEHILKTQQLSDRHYDTLYGIMNTLCLYHALLDHTDIDDVGESHNDDLLPFILRIR